MWKRLLISCLSNMPTVHLIGIGGAGLSAIATVLLQQGYTVSGSDLQASAATERLAQLGATIAIGHRPENLPGPPVEAVVISSAVKPNNPELLAAQQRGLHVVKRAEWLGRMTQNRTCIAIAGTHGKTTTTAMIAYLLQQAGQQPGYIVGGFVPQLNSNAAAGQGDAFVVEADEYDYMFLGLRPQIAVLTFVEWDHPDMFPSPAVFQQAFVDFAQGVPASGWVIGCGDDLGAKAILAHTSAQTITYGLQAGNNWQAVNVQPNQRGGHNFKLIGPAPHLDSLTVSLAVPGLHNVANSLAALVVAHQRGLDLTQATQILGQFTGTGRRFEFKGEVNGIIVIDDYAHHPTEIKATLAAARIRYPGCPIWAVLQPHTFSRTLALLDDFAGAFSEAEHVLIVDIFPSRETDAGLIHSTDILKRMHHPDARYIGPLAAAADYLAQQLTPPAVLITLGAGDGYKVGERVLEQVQTKVSRNQ
jgi:UDP-N-acetylmuramate--alanine ligase